MTQSLEFLGELLRKWQATAAHGRRKGPYLAMEKEIRRFGAKIDRRSLQKIVEGRAESLELRFDQLAALNAFLASAFRVRLGTLFEGANVLSELVAQDKVKVLLGSYPRESAKPRLRRTDLSRWDIRAMQELFLQINKISGSVALSFEDVLSTKTSSDPSAAWARDLEKSQEKMAAVGIGSQRASPATELMLAGMFGVAPFKSVGPDSPPDLPFRFIWDDTAVHASAFSMNVAAVPQLKPDPKKRIPKDQLPWALQIGHDLHKLERFVPKSKTYGILAAQRRHGPDGADQVWLVIAGLSGPGTAAAASFVDAVDWQLPRAEIGRQSPVVWMAVEADVELTDMPGDNRVIVGARRLYGPTTWSRQTAE